MESPRDGEACPLDELLPALLLLPALPLGLVVDEASVGEADLLSWLGDRAEACSGTWADIVGGLSSGAAEKSTRGPRSSGRGQRRFGAGQKTSEEMQMRRRSSTQNNGLQGVLSRGDAGYEMSGYEIWDYDGRKFRGKRLAPLDELSGGRGSLYIDTKAWAGARGPSGKSWRSWHFLALLG